MDIDGWDEAPEFRSYALDPICPRGEPTILFAPGGTGKSYLSLALALSVQLGRELVPGIPPAMTGPSSTSTGKRTPRPSRPGSARSRARMGFDPPRIPTAAARLPSSWFEWMQIPIVAGQQEYTVNPQKGGMIIRLVCIFDTNMIVLPAHMAEIHPPGADIWLTWPQNIAQTGKALEQDNRFDQARVASIGRASVCKRREAGSLWQRT